MFKYENEIKKMRDEGKTFAEIGEKLNIKRQYAHYVYKRVVDDRFTDKQKELIDTVYYKNIKRWLTENNVTLRELCEICSTGKTIAPIWKFLQGKHYGDILTIKNILEVTSMTFEEAFAEDEAT